MRHITRKLALLALLVPACDATDSTERWTVTQRSQHGSTESFEVDTGHETLEVIVFHGPRVRGIVPSADLGATETDEGLRYFDGEGAPVQDASDSLAADLLESAIAGELSVDAAFRLDAAEFVEGAINGASCHAACDAQMPYCVQAGRSQDACDFAIGYCHCEC